MLLDETAGRIVLPFRRATSIGAYATTDGAPLGASPVCGDADDIFLDEARKRIYVVCGEGYVDVLDRADLALLSRIETSPGARTGVYVPELDRLFVAAPDAGRGAAVLVLRPS